jgi:hypothetical protein
MECDKLQILQNSNIDLIISVVHVTDIDLV